MGTFVGHAVPGTALIVWGSWWYGHTLYHTSRAPQPSVGNISDPDSTESRVPLSRLASEREWKRHTYFTPLEPAVKVTFSIAAAIGDLWADGWKYADSTLNNYQHATMYLGFFLAGATDFLEARGLAPRNAGHLALAAAFLLGAIMLIGHSSPSELETRVHQLLVSTMAFLVFLLLLELRYPIPSLSVIKSFALILQGTWLWQTGYMLYVAPYDQSHHTSLMRANLFFAWHCMLTAAVMFAVYYAVIRLRAQRQLNRGVRRATAR